MPFTFVGAPPLWAMVFPFVGALPSGRWVVVWKAYRDEGVAPGDNALHVVGTQPYLLRWLSKKLAMSWACKTHSVVMCWGW